MSLNLEQLMDAANDLPAPQRAELAQFLLSSLSDQDEKPVRDEWLALAERRLADLKAGNVVAIPAEEVLKTLLDPGR